MALDADLQAIVQPHVKSSEPLAAAVFGLCWPNESKLALQLDLEVRQGETVLEAARRLDLGWHPQWLIDAGHSVHDAALMPLAPGQPATSEGAISWSPPVRLCRVDDQIGDRAPPSQQRRRLAGEVALTSLWTRSARSAGIDPAIRPTDLDGNTRGTRFKDILVYLLQQRMPDGWRVEPEVSLTNIRGLHMRKNVGGRRSDIVVVDEGNRLVAVVSSKWTWRSDRGTEAAQIVPLMRYRPDVPYALVTAEFPRAATVGRESIEDRAYHVCAPWVGAWLAVNRSVQASLTDQWTNLDRLADEGKRVAETLGLPGLDDLVRDLVDSGTIL